MITRVGSGELQFWWLLCSDPKLIPIGEYFLRNSISYFMNYNFVTCQLIS